MGKRGIVHRDRGVALLIVLLVTALLIALIFEFAYGTRVSLRGAVNFRDSQRAYFLARSGVAIFTKFKELKDMVPQGEWGVVPIISAGDTEVRFKWEDERGKLNINDVNSTASLTPDGVEQLFSQWQVSTAVLDQVKELRRKDGQLKLLSELRKVMSDEDYSKVAKFLTVSSDNKININTASEDVLNSVLVNNKVAVGMIVNNRKNKLIESLGDVGLTQSNTPNNIFANLVTTNGTLMVYSYATVGGYTKQVESIGTYWSVQ
jgi:type II secretory pathway component PulK